MFLSDMSLNGRCVSQVGFAECREAWFNLTPGSHGLACSWVLTRKEKPQGRVAVQHSVFFRG
jgi:hypothetical protein